MDDLLIHARTKAELSALAVDPPHALMFVAPQNTGKRAIAEAWAHALPGNVELGVLEPDEKGTITIDATRALYQRTRAKQAARQVVIIDHAEAMSSEAQNAFLKLLEEPRSGLTFILTVTAADDVLPTIQSRLQTVQLHAIGANVLSEYVKKTKPNADDQTLTQLLFMANGRPAMLHQLLHDETVFVAQKQIMQRAKLMLSAEQYERLALVQTLSKDKHELTATLEAMGRMVAMQILRNPSARLVAIADALQECLRRLRQNGNVRAQLVHFFTTY